MRVGIFGSSLFILLFGLANAQSPQITVEEPEKELQQGGTELFHVQLTWQCDAGGPFSQGDFYHVRFWAVKQNRFQAEMLEHQHQFPRSPSCDANLTAHATLRIRDLDPELPATQRVNVKVQALLTHNSTIPGRSAEVARVETLATFVPAPAGRLNLGLSGSLTLRGEAHGSIPVSFFGNAPGTIRLLELETSKLDLPQPLEFQDAGTTLLKIAPKPDTRNASPVMLAVQMELVGLKSTARYEERVTVEFEPRAQVVPTASLEAVALMAAAAVLTKAVGTKRKP